MTPVFHALIVDDEAALRQELHDFLSWHDIACQSAENSAEAIAVLANTPEITVVLTDIRMPGEDGLQLANRILRDRGDADAIEVVLMTGHGDIDVATRAVREGVFDFLRKPMLPKDVLDVVRRAHSKAHARRQAFAARQKELAQLRDEYKALQRMSDNTGMLTQQTAGTPPGLARILAHELRTPLVPLLAMPDMLDARDSIPPEQFQEYLGNVKEAGERLQSIAEDLIAFLAPSQAPLSLRDVPVDRVMAVVQMANLSQARAHGVDLVCEQAAVGDVSTDLETLSMALGRLVANGIAASSRGGQVMLSVTATADDEVAFNVRDNGAGMTPDQVAVARLPFRQLDMSLARKNAGMGLGLSLTASAAERLGGRLAIQSAPGAGTTASIILPRQQSKEHAA